MDNRALTPSNSGRVDGAVRCLVSVVDGPCLRGMASNLSLDGLYVEVAGDAFPGRDAEVDIFLGDSSEIPGLHLRGVVARRSTPEDESSEGHFGVGVRIKEAPPEYESLFCTPNEDRENRRSHTPYPLLAYDGNTLDDIYELLEELGAQPRRAHVRGPDRLSEWKEAPKLLLVDASDALTLDVPSSADRQGVLRVAVASSQSEILANLLRRLGYQYLVRRPLHRDAIEILMRNLLHKGQSRRASPRVVLGIDANLQTNNWGWNQPCSLLDLSRGGCLLSSSRRISLRKKVRLVVGSEATGGEELSLTGHVIRRREDDASGNWQIALRFHPPADVQGAQIGRLLQRTTVGPKKTYKPTTLQTVAAFADRLSSFGRKRVPLPGHTDRRRDRRSRLDRHVCKMDESGTRVTALLTGYDLTCRGMRVQPHPELELGTYFTVSLHDEARKRPVEIAAEVVRNDGADGLALRFVDLDAELTARIEALVAALPAADSLVMAGIESSIESIGAH